MELQGDATLRRGKESLNLILKILLHPLCPLPSHPLGPHLMERPGVCLSLSLLVLFLLFRKLKSLMEIL